MSAPRRVGGGRRGDRPPRRLTGLRVSRREAYGMRSSGWKSDRACEAIGRDHVTACPSLVPRRKLLILKTPGSETNGRSGSEPLRTALKEHRVLPLADEPLRNWYAVGVDLRHPCVPEQGRETRNDGTAKDTVSFGFVDADTHVNVIAPVVGATATFVSPSGRSTLPVSHGTPASDPAKAPGSPFSP